MAKQALHVGSWVVARVAIGELDEQGNPLLYARPGDLGQVIRIEDPLVVEGIGEFPYLPTIQWPGGVFGCSADEIMHAFPCIKGS